MNEKIIKALAQRLKEYDSGIKSETELRRWAYRIRDNLAGVYEEDNK